MNVLSKLIYDSQQFCDEYVHIVKITFTIENTAKCFFVVMALIKNYFYLN